MVRTRIAPSPTGQDLHIGNAYMALINYVFSKKHKGRFIIRIEDTDRQRLVKGSEERIFKSLRWLGVAHDEGPDIGGTYAPYRQSERLELYQKFATELIAKDQAYYCFCTPQRLETMRKDLQSRHKPSMYDGFCRSISPQDSSARVKKGAKYTIRLKVPKEGRTHFHDIIRGDVSFENKLIDDQVLLKSDGFPTYHLGVVVDDHVMEITHVIRGEEWISSTPKHVLLYKSFGWDLPVYAHMPLLRNPDKSKLSKRKHPVWVSWYRQQGYLPQVLRNYLALMAWTHPDGKELFTTNEFIEQFTLENIQTTAPVFDIEKLRWMNGEYIRQMKDSDLVGLLLDFYNHTYPEDQILGILPIVKDRIKTLLEFSSLAEFFFKKPEQFERPCNSTLIDIVQRSLEQAKWNHEAMEKSIRQYAAEENVKARDLFMELRIAVTGKTVGPPILESLQILGREETLLRLKRSAKQVSESA